MSKYSDEFKIKAVQMVLDGNAVKYVCRILAIPDSRPLRDWLAHYNHGGIHQLLHKNRSYSPDFKQKVFEHLWQHGVSLRETAALFAIPNASIICQWQKQYLAYGKSGLLPKKKGRTPMKYKPKNANRNLNLLILNSWKQKTLSLKWRTPS